jgi:hemolysin activation/secretion protein
VSISCVKLRSGVVGIFILLALTFLCSPARADSESSTNQVEEKIFELPPISPIENSGHDDTLIVSTIIFEGNSAIQADEITSHVSSFLKRRILKIELEQLRQSVTQLYIQRGYVNSGAIIPDGAYKDGILRVKIIEGAIVETRTEGLNALNPRYLTSRLVRKGQPLNVAVLEERMRVLLTDPLFDQINARLVPGGELGAAVLDIKVKRARRFGLSAEASNYQAPAVGSTFISLNGWARNLTTWGDVLDLSARASEGSNHCDLGWEIPLFGSRTLLNVRAAHGSSSVIEEPLDSLNIDSDVNSEEIGVSHPFIDTARRKFTLGVSYGNRENRTSLDGQPFSFVAGEQTGHTIVRDWRFFQDFLQRFDKHVIALRSTLAWGNNNVDNESVIPGQPNRRFFLWVGQGQTASSLWDGRAELVSRVIYQHTPDTLTPVERLSLGGRYSVRGYRENQLVRDKGYMFSAELRYPILGEARSKQQLTLVPFVDYASASNHGGGNEKLASIGLGLQWNFKRLDGELFYGKQLKRPSVESNGDLQDHGIHFRVRLDVF